MLIICHVSCVTQLEPLGELPQQTAIFPGEITIENICYPIKFVKFSFDKTRKNQRLETIIISQM